VSIRHLGGSRWGHRRVSPGTGLICAVGATLSACGGGGGGGGVTNPGGGNPTATISVSPASINVGQTATLSWSSTNADFCEGRNAWTGSEALSGTMTVTPVGPGTFTYKLVCSDFKGNGNQASATATLSVGGGTAYGLKGLVSDTAGGGGTTVDRHLVNPWGIAVGATTPVWVANNGDQSSTLYDGTGTPYPTTGALTVHLPASATGTAFSPTAIVFNRTNDFSVTASGKSAPAQFIFVGEGGSIAGWSSSVDPNNAIVVYSDAGGAVYKGLAIATTASGSFLYATDFHNGKIDRFDARFAKQTPTPVNLTFKDVSLPSGYAPFGILALANGPAGAFQLYVTYAQQKAPDNHDNTNGVGLGVVDVWDTEGNFVKRLVSDGAALNAPWGMALAPADFGDFSNALLVGNFGDGRINAYEPSSGAFLGTVMDVGGAAVSIPGLWGITFGNDTLSQPHNTLFFAAGTNDETNGLYGRIDLPSTP